MMSCIFIIQWQASGPDLPEHPWLQPTVLTMLGFGSTTIALRLQLLARRQRADPELDPDKAFDANADGRQLLRRFDRTGDVVALDDGVEQLRTAVVASAGDPRRTEYAANLVMALRGRYQRRGEPADLDAAIDAGREAARSERTDDPRRGGLLSQLCSALRLRYDHFGDSDDLEEAVSVGRDGVGAAASRHREDYVRCLTELGAAFRSRYDRTGELDDLDGAIEQLELARAVTLAVDRPYVRVAHLTELCALLVQRHGRVRRLADLDRAVAIGRNAAAGVPAGYRLYETAQSNLAQALRDRYEVRRDTADLHEAIDCAQRAVTGAAVNDPGRASHLIGLAQTLHARHRLDRDQRDIEQALAMAREATASPLTDPITRMRAGLVWSHVAASGAAYAEAVEAFEAVIEFLPQVASQELRRADQEFLLGRWAGTAATAAACAIAGGYPAATAVRFLEQGRGVLLSRALDANIDLALLHERHPELAQEFERLRRQLGSMYEYYEDRPERELERRTRRTLVADWNRLMRKIRTHEGFGKFARLPTFDDVLLAARHGPVVFLNVSTLRSDAILLDHRLGVRTLPLPDVTPNAVREQTRTLHEALQPETMLDLGQQQRFAEVLAWLWDAMIERVLNELGIGPPAPGQDLPRIWWIPTGPLAVMPIHAAGRHDTRTSAAQNLLDRAVSSYTPTLRALIHARRRPTVSARSRPLVVSMGQTPGAPALPSAATEAEVVRRLFPGTRVLTDEHATRAQVLAELPGRSWAHFACHAVVDTGSPSLGRLLLHDHHRHPLTVLDLSRLNLQNAELAYLSACDTATSPDDRLFDEAIHLASSFQLAGFAHVIATLWPLYDGIAAGFAEPVYRRLATRVEPDAAVHDAVCELREKYPNLTSVWAGLIHVGS